MSDDGVEGDPDGEQRYRLLAENASDVVVLGTAVGVVRSVIGEHGPAAMRLLDVAATTVGPLAGEEP